MDDQVFRKLYRWARFRHPRKNRGWCFHRYWRRQGYRNNFGHGTSWLARYADTPIVRHVKVRGDKSPGACPERTRRDGDLALLGRAVRARPDETDAGDQAVEATKEPLRALGCASW